MTDVGCCKKRYGSHEAGCIHESGGIRLWHDDVRPPPEGWVWARTNAAAKAQLATGLVVAISMDHDLGLDYIEMPATYAELQTADPEQAHAIFLAGRSEQTGEHLAQWMAETDCIPASVTIHSWNPDGAKRMKAWLPSAAVVPFRP